jgi:ATP-dependent Clp protease ATP-binding subunit ClpA
MSLRTDCSLFIDEFHTIVTVPKGNTGVSGATTILDSVLYQKSIQCIGATTVAEYNVNIEKTQTLSHRFNVVKIPEPSTKESIQILLGVKSRYEIHHSITIDDSAIFAAAT